MNSADNSIKISLKELWRPFLGKVPAKFKIAIVQKDREWSVNILKGMLSLWTAWFVGLTIFSDFQKTGEVRTQYISIRMAVVLISICTQYYLKKPNLSQMAITGVTLFLATLYLSSYLAFSFLSLPIRTTWVTILPAAFILSTPRSGRGAILTYSVLVTCGLFIFKQQINTIYIVSDFLFGIVLIGGGLIIKDLWIKSIILMLEQEESHRTSLQKEINILEAVESFIPKGIRNRIRSGLSSGESISTIIETMSKPTEQYIAVLYSDYRNYCKQAGNINFIETELVVSSQTIIELSEQNNAIVQNRGDSLLSAFLGEERSVNICRALLVGIKSALNEFSRVNLLGKSKPDRYMIVTSGVGFFCSLGDKSRQEIVVSGKPANLAARIDEITKIEKIKQAISQTPCVLFDFETKKALVSANLGISFEEIDLRKENIEIRSYTEERRIYILHYSPENAEKLEHFIQSFQDKQEIA